MTADALAAWLVSTWIAPQEEARPETCAEEQHQPDPPPHPRRLAGERGGDEVGEADDEGDIGCGPEGFHHSPFAISATATVIARSAKASRRRSGVGMAIIPK